MEQKEFNRNEIGEKVIAYLKSKNTGIASKDEIFHLDLGKWNEVSSVFIFLEDLQLIEIVSASKLRLTSKGFDFVDFHDFLERNSKDEVKNDLEILKLKKELKDYYMYKIFAIIGFITGIIGAVISIISLLNL